jgi:hypothetical protein
MRVYKTVLLHGQFREREIERIREYKTVVLHGQLRERERERESERVIVYPTSFQPRNIKNNFQPPK